MRKRISTNRNRRRGTVLVSYSFIMIALMGIGSLAVDYGHVQVVKSQLEISVDAAARAGAAQLASGGNTTQVNAAITAAMQTAALNVSDNQSVSLLSSDIICGNWDSTQTPRFSASRTPVNAVQVTAHRQTARGNPVTLLLAPLIGARSCDVSAISIASVAPPQSSYGIAGINHLNFGSAGVLAKISGDVASNDDIGVGSPLGLLVSVTGNAQTYSGTVRKGTAATIGGCTTPLTSSLYYPPVQIPTANNNANIASYLDSNSNFIGVGSVSIPGGTYVVKNLNLLADVNMDLRGPVTFYVTGAFNMAASFTLLGSANTASSNFTVMVYQGGSVNFLANISTPIQMNIYAPSCAISITVGISNFTGELIGQTLDINLPLLGTFTEVKPTATPQVISQVQ